MSIDEKELLEPWMADYMVGNYDTLPRPCLDTLGQPFHGECKKRISTAIQSALQDAKPVGEVDETYLDANATLSEIVFDARSGEDECLTRDFLNGAIWALYDVGLLTQEFRHGWHERMRVGEFDDLFVSPQLALLSPPVQGAPEPVGECQHEWTHWTDCDHRICTKCKAPEPSTPVQDGEREKVVEAIAEKLYDEWCRGAKAHYNDPEGAEGGSFSKVWWKDFKQGWEIRGPEAKGFPTLAEFYERAESLLYLSSPTPDTEREPSE